MNQSEKLLNLFHQHGDRLTLGQILDAWNVCGSKYTNRLSDIRQMGYTVTCKQDRDMPTENIYTIEKIPTVYREPSGQMALVLK